MRIRLRILKPEAVKWLRRELQRGERTRAALGRGLCDQDGWRNRQGQWCAASARKALPPAAGRATGMAVLDGEMLGEARPLQQGSNAFGQGFDCSFPSVGSSDPSPEVPDIDLAASVRSQDMVSRMSIGVSPADFCPTPLL